MKTVFEKAAEWYKNKRSSEVKMKEKEASLKNEKEINSVVFNNKVYVHITGDAILDVEEFNLDLVKVINSMRKSRVEWDKHKQIV